MRSRRGRKTVGHIQIPPYFPPSRYETVEGDLVVDNENHKILSLPSLVTFNINERSKTNHVGPRSIKNEMLHEAKNALLGESQTSNGSSDGVHPGILYGGPAGGILAPIGVWFFKLFKKRRKRKKQRKAKQLEESDDEDSEYDNNTSNITTAVGNQITQAGSSIVNHIKGKITNTGSFLVNDLKSQAIAEEEEILQNIRKTILEQEEAMMTNITQKITSTRKNLVDDLKNKISLSGKSSIEPIEVDSEELTFEGKRKEEESSYKLSDSETELTNTVTRRISNALIPEIEKSIETANENIIRNIEIGIPEARGPIWEKTKYRMKESGTSLFNEIKSILTSTENKIIDHLNSEIDETKTDTVPEQMVTAIKIEDKVKVAAIQPEIIQFKGGGYQVTRETSDANKNDGGDKFDKLIMRNEKAEVPSRGISFFNKIKHKIIPPFIPNHSSKTLLQPTQPRGTGDNSMNEMNLNTEISVHIRQTKLNAIKPIESLLHLKGSFVDVKQSQEAEVCTHLDLNDTINTEGFRVNKNSVPDRTILHTNKKVNEIEFDVIQPVEPQVTVEEIRVNMNDVTNCNDSSKTTTVVDKLKHDRKISHERDETEKEDDTAIEKNNLNCEINKDNRKNHATEVNIKTGKEMEFDQGNKVESQTNDVSETDTVIEHLEAPNEYVLQHEEAKVPSKDSIMLHKIKQKMSIPLQFLKHSSKPPSQIDQDEGCDDGNTKICIESIQRTLPIPIPVHQTQPNGFPATKAVDTHESICYNSSESSSGNENKEDTSFFDKMKNSVSNLPFSMNFSGIPNKIISFMESKKHDDSCDIEINSGPSEENIVSENMFCSELVIGETGVEHIESKKTDTTRHIRFPDDINGTENISTRKWIVHDYIDAKWPEHLPRKKYSASPDSQKKKDSEVVDTSPMAKWLQLFEEDVNSSWPDHLPKNLHVVRGTAKKAAHEMKEQRSGKHMRSKRSQPSYDDSESPEEDEQEEKNSLSRNLLMKPIDNENDRKESLVSTISEFSTTSSVDSTSSGTVESRDSFSGCKLPNFDSKLRRNRNRNERLKSLDSGIHHYYGEYIAIEFPVADSGHGGQNITTRDYSRTESTTTRSIIESVSQKTIDSSIEGEKILYRDVEDNLQASERGSSENSLEEVRSVISRAETVTTEESTTDIRTELLQEESVRVGEGYYEGCIVSLEYQKIQQFTTKVPDTRFACYRNFSKK